MLLLCLHSEIRKLGHREIKPCAKGTHGKEIVFENQTLSFHNQHPLPLIEYSESNGVVRWHQRYGSRQQDTTFDTLLLGALNWNNQALESNNYFLTGLHEKSTVILSNFLKILVSKLKTHLQKMLSPLALLLTWNAMHASTIIFNYTEK